MAYTFGAGASPFGAIANFDVVSISENTSKDSAVHTNASGWQVHATGVAFNAKDEYTVEYEANVNTAVGGATVPIQTGNYCVTSISVKVSNTGHARITVSGHSHGSAHNALTDTITLPTFTGFGATCLMGSTLTAAEVISSTWTATVGHTDRQNNVGDWLVGIPHGIKIECTTEAVTDTKVTTAPTGWIYLGSGESEGNQDFQTVSLRGEQYVAKAA